MDDTMFSETFTHVLLLLFIFLLCYSAWKFLKVERQLDHMPGPKGIPFFGILFAIDNPKFLHKFLSAVTRKYGQIFKLRGGPFEAVVVSGYESIHEVLITKGRETAGRETRFRLRYALKGTGILFSSEPDKTWKMLRKVSQRHFKQFGEGMTKLECLITEIAEDMFGAFDDNAGVPFDPKRAITDTAVKNIAFLVTGQRYKTEDQLLKYMEEYEPLFMKYVVSVSPIKNAIFDGLPWLRHFNTDAWKKINRVLELEDIVWGEIKARIKDQPENMGLARLLLSHTTAKDFGTEEVLFTEVDAKRTCMSLFLAGRATTSSSFYALLNILAHTKRVQNKISQEITDIVPDGRNVSLDDKHRMPYTRATVLELLRYFTVVQAGVPHRTLTHVKLQGYTVPPGILLATALWTLHHDADFWGDPDVFRPERFLDDQGEVVPADHPNRKHLIPFGTGPRVCLGESLALARLFLWMAVAVQRFEIVPAEGNDPSLIDTKSYFAESVMYSKPYSVIFKRRKV